MGKYQQAHNRGGDGKNVYGGGGDVLRTLGQRMELLGRQVDDGSMAVLQSSPWITRPQQMIIVAHSAMSSPTMQPAMTVHTPATSMTLMLRSVLTAVTKPSIA